MSDFNSDQRQAQLYELMSGYSQSLNELLDDLTNDFQKEFGENEDPLFLHIQLLAQHLGKAIAAGPRQMRDELLAEARIQENLVIENWDNPEDLDLASMPVKGRA